MKTKIAQIAVFLWAVLIFIFYYKGPERTVPILANWRELFLLILIITASSGIGIKILRKLKITCQSYLEEFLISAGLGMGILGYAIFFAGIFGGLYLVFAYIILAAMLIFTFSELKVLFLKFSDTLNSGFISKASLFQSLLLFFAVSGAVISLLFALIPTTFYDTLVYHFGIPNLYALKHRIFYYPYDVHSNFPFLSEMLFLFGILLDGEILSQLINYSFSIILFLSVFAFGKKFIGTGPAILASCVFFLSPSVLELSILPLADMGFAFFSFLGFFALINWLSSREKNWIYIAAIFTGFSMSTRYTAIMFSLAIYSIIIISSIVIDHRKAGYVFKYLLLFVLIALVIGSPWYVKNIINTGNPFYPAFFSIFEGIDWSQEKEIALLGPAAPPPKELGNALEFLSLPWKMTISPDPLKFGVGADIGPMFLLLFPLLFFFKKYGRVEKYLIIHFFFYLLFFAFSFWLTRTAVLMFATYYLLTASLMFSLKKNTNSFFVKGFKLTILFILLVNINVFLARQNLYFNSLPTAIGAETGRDYLFKNMRSYSSIEYANENLPSGARILFIGEARNAYCKRDYVYSSAFNTNPIVTIVKNSRNMEEIKRALKQEGFTHVLFDPAETSRLEQQYSYLGWTADENEIFGDFLKRGTNTVFGNNRVYLLEIL